LGDIEAVALPDTILERFKPTIEAAGISYNKAPDPLNDPLTKETPEPDMDTDPEIVTLEPDMFCDNHLMLSSISSKVS
jgi:hypothetical protein